jgi:hypothetical protein
MRGESELLVIELTPARSLLALLITLALFAADFPSTDDSTPDPVAL